MDKTIVGEINEVRRTFSGSGVHGNVEFGAFDRRGNFQFVKVILSDGRAAHGKYRNAGNVRLTLKAIYNRAGKRIG